MLRLLALVAVVLLAGPAVASPQSDEVLAGLRTDRLYVAPDSAITPDAAAVREALAGTGVPTYVAVLAQADVDSAELGIDGLMLEVVEGLADAEAVVYLVSDQGELQAGEGGASGVDAAGILDRVLDARLDKPFDGPNLTAALVDIAAQVDAQADPQQPGSTRRTVGLAGLVATVAIGGGGLLWSRSQRRLRAQAPLTDDREPEAPGWH